MERRVPIVAQQLTNPTRNHEVVGSIPGLAQWVGESSIAVSCGIGRRHGSDPVLLWLWCRLGVWCSQNEDGERGPYEAVTQGT